MIIPQTFTDTFGLEPDKVYLALEKVAEGLPDGQLTTDQMMQLLKKKYRHKSKTNKEWIMKVNKTIDQLVKMEFFTYKEGYFYKNHN